MARTAPFHGVNRGSIPLGATKMKEVIVFLVAFTLPFVYWRSLFLFATKKFDKPFSRTKTGLQIHHAHFGIIIVLTAAMMILFGEKSIYFFGVLGLGLGLVMDEYIPSLYMPGDRPLELKVYKESLGKTFYLFLVFIILVLLIYWFK